MLCLWKNKSKDLPVTLNFQKYNPHTNCTRSERYKPPLSRQSVGVACVLILEVFSLPTLYFTLFTQNERTKQLEQGKSCAESQESFSSDFARFGAAGNEGTMQNTTFTIVKSYIRFSQASQLTILYKTKRKHNEKQKQNKATKKQ